MKSKQIGYQSEEIKTYKKIKNGSREHIELFTLEGTWAYEKVLQTNVKIIHLFYCQDFIQNDMQQMMIQDLASRSLNVYEISPKTMSRINSKENSCFCMVCQLNHTKKNYRKVLILDGLENPGNIGTIFRSADGAGIDAIFTVNQLVKMNQHKVVKASMGGYMSIPHMNFDSIESCMTYLNKLQLPLILADPKQASQLSSTQDFALVVGNERYGISEQWFKYDHRCIALPMNGCCDSLNVGVAASILIYNLS